MAESNLRYHTITLIVPQRKGEMKPDAWDWNDLTDTGPPIWVCSCDPLPKAEAAEFLRTNGFGDPGDLVDQLAEDARDLTH